MGQTISSRSMSERQCRSLTAWDQQINASNWATNRNELKTSRSDPALPIPLSPPPAVGGGGEVVMVSAIPTLMKYPHNTKKCQYYQVIYCINIIHCFVFFREQKGKRLKVNSLTGLRVVDKAPILSPMALRWLLRHASSSRSPLSLKMRARWAPLKQPSQNSQCEFTFVFTLSANRCFSQVQCEKAVISSLLIIIHSFPCLRLQGERTRTDPEGGCRVPVSARGELPAVRSYLHPTYQFQKGGHETRGLSLC